MGNRFTSLMGKNPPEDTEDSPSNRLSPLAQRLCKALDSIAVDDPRMRLGVAGFVKYLRKSPPDDTDIAEALTWVRDMADQVLNPVAEQLPGMPDSPELLDELTGMWEASDLSGGEADTANQQLAMNLDASDIVEATA